MKKVLKGLGVAVLSGAIIGIFSLSVMAQAPAGRKYKIDASTSLNINNNTIDPESGEEMDMDTFLVNVGVGFFVNNMFEIGPEFEYSSLDINDEVTISGWSLGVRANAHFNTGGPVVPYVGINLAFSDLGLEFEDDNFDEDETSFRYGAQVGLDYFLNENVSINPQLRYTTATYEFQGVDFDETNLNIFIGFAVHF